MQEKPSIRILTSETFDPYFNLATEDWIFHNMDPNIPILFLWRNKDTVVIGRFQNPWTECNTQKMETDNIHLARRQSGGGAVFHDLGNTNFTFMSNKKSYNQNRNNQVIITALKKFNINAQASGRNDLVILDSEGEKKFSGSAFKKNTDRCFHHGTLLINANLQKLSNYLNPNKKKLQSKGIKSVRARVTNLSSLNPKIKHKTLCQEIIQEFQNIHNTSCEIEVLDQNYLKTIPSLNEYYEKLKDWNWRFGKTPDFNHQMEERFEWGQMEVHLNTHRGVIKEVQIFSDCLYPSFITTIQEHLLSQSYDKLGVEKAMASVKRECSGVINSSIISEFQSWLTTRIS